MTFNLYSLGSKYESDDCYFRLEAAQTSLYSPIFPDQRTALEAMKELVLRLRVELAPIVRTDNGFVLQLFPKSAPAIHQAVFFASRMLVANLQQELQLLAKATAFPLVFLELPEKLEEIDTPADLDFTIPGLRYDWQEVSTGLLRVEESKAVARSAAGWVNPSLNLNPASLTKPCDPLFNILQPQVAADLPFFLGRKQEVEDLYALSRNNRLILLYGKERVGKTSLIQCGLANRMEAQPGELIVHQRQEAGILPSLKQHLRDELAQLQGEPVTDQAELPELLNRLSAQQPKPVVLVFDQLENIFQPAVSEWERSEFFDFLSGVLSDESLPYRIILSLREAFLAPLADYEKRLPQLLTQRYRVQPLSKKSMVDVSVNLFDLFKNQHKLSVDQPELVSEKICSQLANDKGEVPYTCLQIYLQQAHQKSCAQSSGQIPAFTAGFIDEMGPARDVIDDYISQEIRQLEDQLPPQGEAENPALRQKIDELNASRQQCGCNSASTAVLPVAAAGAAGAVVASPNRKYRWLLLLPLLFSIGALWVIYDAMQAKDPCHTAREANSCEAALNYLMTYGEEGACAAEFQVLLSNNQCSEWEDYRLLQTTKTCGSYLSFYQKYRNTSVATERVEKSLLEWQCPMVRDTVQVTLRDTVYQDRPSGYTQTGPRLTPKARGSSSPGCKVVDGSNFKQVGPLLMMTDPLAGGPYNWADALDACNARGWRLPCIGEIDFLIQNIYRNQAANAYKMLSGSGECYLFNPSEAPGGRIDFWTGTEANDATSWTFYFDSETETIGRESNINKSRKLPCLCVKKEVEDGASGLPPCYNKTVDRRPG